MTNLSEIPDAAWITKTLERDTVTGGGWYSQGMAREYPTRTRVVGTLQGEHPELGRVRIIPSLDHDMRVTDVNAVLHADGRLEPLPDTL